MEDDHVPHAPQPVRRTTWNKGKLVGAKPPLRPSHVWSIRTKLQIEGKKRDLALFNLAIDSKLRGCDVVAVCLEQFLFAGRSNADRHSCSDTRRSRGRFAISVSRSMMRSRLRRRSTYNAIPQ